MIKGSLNSQDISLDTQYYYDKLIKNINDNFSEEDAKQMIDLVDNTIKSTIQDYKEKKVD